MGTLQHSYRLPHSSVFNAPAKFVPMQYAVYQSLETVERLHPMCYQLLEDLKHDHTWVSLYGHMCETFSRFRVPAQLKRRVRRTYTTINDEPNSLKTAATYQPMSKQC